VRDTGICAADAAQLKVPLPRSGTPEREELEQDGASVMRALLDRSAGGRWSLKARILSADLILHLLHHTTLL
jgi:hypothetical protein